MCVTPSRPPSSSLAPNSLARANLPSALHRSLNRGTEKPSGLSTETATKRRDSNGKVGVRVTPSLVWEQRSEVWPPCVFSPQRVPRGVAQGKLPCCGGGGHTEEASPAAHPGLAMHQTPSLRRNVKCPLVLLTVVQVKHAGPDSE